MCGRYTIRRIDLLIRFGAMESPGFDTFDEHPIVPRFNVAPSQDVPIVRLNDDGKRQLSLVQWGFIPSWAKEEPKLKPINARAETIATSGMFRTAFDRRRCLIPADGFYEWRKLDAKRKQPTFIHRRDDEPFAFAGIYDRWKPDKDAAPIETMTIITTAPNDLMEPIHNRMPVVLRESEYDRWLDRHEKGIDVLDMIKSRPWPEFETYHVSTYVNKPSNIGPECVEPAR